MNRVRGFAAILLLFVTTAAMANPGDGVLGSFDASHEDDPVLPYRIWRSYSVVDPSIWYAGSSPDNLVSTRLAVSDDQGAHFTDIGLLNPAQDLPVPGLSWVNEVSSLVFDPSDPAPASDWKVIWDHHLLNTNLYPGDVRDYHYGWIGLKEAGLPVGPWSQEVKLIAGSEYDPQNSLSPGYPLFPLPSGLTDCLVLTEPGTLGAQDGFYMAFQCQSGAQAIQMRVPLVKFQHAPNGATVLQDDGTLLGPGDAALFASTYSASDPELSQVVNFTAPDLFVKDGVVYLIVSPINSSFAYLGCAVFQVSDLNTASVARLPNGAPQMVDYISGMPGSFRGACTYSAASSASGVVLSQLVPASSQPFTLVPTLFQIP